MHRSDPSNPSHHGRPESPSSQRIQFGNFVLDRQTLELWNGDTLLSLEPLPARLLVRLAESPDELVTRDELLHLGWPRLPGAAEQSLNTCIHQIRQALSSGADPDVRIDTLRGRGYRLRTPEIAREAHGANGRRRTPWALAGVAAAILAISTWLATSSSPPETEATEVARVLERAQYLASETRDLTGARALLDTARARMPGVAALHAEWGDLGVWLGDLRGADRASERALELDPNEPTALRTRAHLAMLDGDWDRADALMRRARTEGPEDVRTLTSLAWLRIVQGRPREAMAWMEEALRGGDLTATLYEDAGLIYLMAGNLTEADRWCREVLRFQPAATWALDCLFDVARLRRKPGEALEWGQRRLAVSEADPPELTSIEDVLAWRLERWSSLGADEGAIGKSHALVGLGRLDEALEQLAVAARTPNLGVLGIAADPRLAPLRGRPEFTKLVRQLGVGSSSIELETPAGP